MNRYIAKTFDFIPRDFLVSFFYCCAYGVASLSDNFDLFYSGKSLFRILDKIFVYYTIKIRLNVANGIEDMLNPNLITERTSHR